ncbi:hypothetical protein X738_31785 [Mesorhizobium sp. LNHC209A00]|nr:hypothetical protein X738_31785 [Mesorhizobium sp. LNHC209A00]
MKTGTSPLKPWNSKAPAWTTGIDAPAAKPGPSTKGMPSFLVVDSSRAARFTGEPIAV